MLIRLNQILSEKRIKGTELSTMLEANGTPLSKESISKIRNNKQSPNLSTIENIAKALNVHPVELFELDGFDVVYKKDQDGNDTLVGYIKKNESIEFLDDADNE